MKRLYLCGPMSGLPDLNFPAFNAEAERLRGLGYDVVNPAELNGGADELASCATMSKAEMAAHWSKCLRTDIRMLLMCDGIAMLPGWERSRGANLEWLIATELGMPVYDSGLLVGADDDSATLPAEACVQLRARHFTNTAAALRLAREETRAEAAAAHQQASKFLRMAVEAAMRGVVQ